MEEIFMLVKSELNEVGYDETLLAAGVVVTGGASIMKGVPELAERIFDLPVRRGMPTNIGGLVDVVNSPIYSTGVGLVQYGMEFDSVSRFRKSGQDHLFPKILARMKQWFKEFF
jgi:cell division protein FtsA